MLKTFDRHLADVKSHLAQRKTVSAKRLDQGFFETCDKLEENRKQQRLLLEPKYFENFEIDTKRFLEEKSKVLRSVVGKVHFLRDIESFRKKVADCQKDTVRACKLVEAAKPTYNDLPNLEKKLKAENDSEKDIVQSNGRASRKPR